MLMLAAIQLRRLGTPDEARSLLDALASRGVVGERRALYDALAAELDRVAPGGRATTRRP